MDPKIDIPQDWQTIEREKKMRSVLDNLLEGVQVIDFNWRYVYANNAVVLQSRFSREELIGYTMMEKYSGIENTELFEALKLCMTMRVAKHFENKFTYPDGSLGWFDLSIQPAEEGIIILSNDITQRKKAEKEKIEYYQHLQRLYQNASHHLRQPVVQALGIINLLKSNSMNLEDTDKLFQHLFDSVSALDRYTREITEDLLNIETDSKDKK